jgi:DNA-binding IclR family transcriptional regulator
VIADWLVAALSGSAGGAGSKVSAVVASASGLVTCERYNSQTGLRQVAEPFLYDIYAATLATVHLAVREGLDVLYLDRLSGRRSVPIVSRVGTRLPAHATAGGKILLPMHGRRSRLPP